MDGTRKTELGAGKERQYHHGGADQGEADGETSGAAWPARSTIALVLT